MTVAKSTQTPEPQAEPLAAHKASLENNWSDNFRLLNGQPVPFDWPTLDDVVTEDDTPVDSIVCERQQRLLTEPLYSSWSALGENRPFVALSNVGLFHARGENPLVPDMMLSLDVTSPQGKEIWLKHYRAYFIHDMAKHRKWSSKLYPIKLAKKPMKNLRNMPRLESSTTLYLIQQKNYQKSSCKSML